MTLSLEYALTHLSSLNREEDQKLKLKAGFLNPGYWVIVATLAKQKKYTASNIVFHNDYQERYASAIALHENLVDSEVYTKHRMGKGRAYSPLTQLRSKHDVNMASSMINGSIRHQCGEITGHPGVVGLCNIVGELHDNVWSHGQSTGFSLSQAYQGQIEFALADMGLGLKGEMARTGIKIASDKDAIDWCMLRGNSTKLNNRETDEWSQRVTDDLIGRSPFGDNISTFDSENNHQGLGLAKLKELVMKYNGHLVIASGNSLYSYNNYSSTARNNYTNLNDYWQGVAISCKFRIRDLKRIEADNETSEVAAIIDILGGGDL